MPDISIEREEISGKGRYVGRIAEGEAEIVFTRLGPTLVSADHTEAPASMRGSGAALALVEYMIADARNSGFRVLPVCPYVQAQFRKHPEWADVTAT